MKCISDDIRDLKWAYISEDIRDLRWVYMSEDIRHFGWTAYQLSSLGDSR